MYRVIKAFTDLQDLNHVYQEGDVYPRKGYKPTEERVDSLVTGLNSRGTPFIVKEDRSVADEKPAKKGASKSKKAK